jgi:sugar (pentulose or hexulose) kinase
MPPPGAFARFWAGRVAPQEVAGVGLTGQVHSLVLLEGVGP